MKKLLAFFSIIILMGCDDGNIDVPEFVFDDTLADCSSTNGSTITHVFYKTNDSEALSVQFTTADADFLTTEGVKTTISLSETGTNTISYRTFNNTITGNSYFCQNIPPNEPTIVNEWTGTGNLIMETVETQDDEDTVEEDVDDTLDSDEDGIPNYIDRDDDNDGVLTKNEDVDGDGDPTNDDTDGDGIANYLDKDDDGDDIDTLKEGTNDDDEDDIPNYLDADSGSDTEENNLDPDTNQYTFIYTTTVTINNLNLTNTNESTIRFDTYVFGEIIRQVPFPGEEEGSK